MPESMGALTETEIFDAMAHNLRLAIDHCEQLATAPKVGLVYRQFREELKLVEGCCRQASAWREDTRFLPLGQMMEQVHQKAGDWIRGVKDPETGRRIPLAEGHKHPLFEKLAEKLREALSGLEHLRTAKTGRTGAILPVPHRETRTQGRQVQVALPPGLHRRNSGLIVPDGAAAQ